MAEQLLEKIMYPGGYVDDIMSINSFDELLSLPRGKKFIGLTITVTNSLKSNNDNAIPVDVWLSESRNEWVLKNIPPIDSLESLDIIPSSIKIPNGFRVSLKSGESFVFGGYSDEDVKIWNNDFSQEKLDKTISNLVTKDELSEELTSLEIPSIEGLASEEWVNNQGFLKEHQDISHLATKEEVEAIKSDIPNIDNLATKDELQQVVESIPNIDGLASEEWVNNQGFLKEHQDISHLAASADVVNAIEDVKALIPNIDNLATKDEIPSLEGYATETFVKNAIADAQLSGGSEIDLSGYATKDDIKNLANKNDIVNYTSGAGISIENNKINVLIETGDTENRNYIKVNEDNSLSVEEIGLDDAVTTEEITVNGGAWANAIQDIYGNTIPVGTSFQDFLKAMSCKEYFISDYTVTSSFTVSCGTLKPELIGANNNDTVEVGTQVTLGKINGNKTTATQKITISGLTYGYKIGENGEKINSQTYTETPLPIVSGESGTTSLKVTFTKFASLITGGAIATKTGEGSIEQTVMYVQEGQNTVHIYQTGDTYTSNTALTGGTLYISTNLNNFYKSDKKTLNTYTPTFQSLTKTATASTTYNVNGAHKYYIGDIAEFSNNYWNTDRSEIIRDLAISDWATASTISDVAYTFKVGTKQQTVVVPSTYTTVEGKDVNNGDVTFNLVKTINFTNAQGYISSYKVFVAPAPDGLGANSEIKITIKK